MSHTISQNLIISHQICQILTNFTIAHQISLNLTKSHQISLNLTKSHHVSLNRNKSHHITDSHQISPNLIESQQISPKLNVRVGLHVRPYDGEDRCVFFEKKPCYFILLFSAMMKERCANTSPSLEFSVASSIYALISLVSTSL